MRACVCACVCAQSASVCSKCIQISSLMFEPIAYFFPQKNKTLSLGFYSTHTLLYLPDDDLSKNAKFETRIAREHGATDERPISETDSKKNTKKNTKQQQHPRIRIKKSTTETTEEERPTPYAKTNRHRHRDFKTSCVVVYFNNGASSSRLSRFSGKRALARRGHATRDRAVFFAHSTEKRVARGLNAQKWGVADALRAFSRTFHPPKRAHLFSLLNGVPTTEAQKHLDADARHGTIRRTLPPRRRRRPPRRRRKQRKMGPGRDASDQQRRVVRDDRERG